MAELRRKFYERLVQWKNTKRQECLLVKGARQVGKTFIVEKFGREQHESFIEINFVLEPDACSIFDGSLKAVATYRPRQGRTLGSRMSYHGRRGRFSSAASRIETS